MDESCLVLDNMIQHKVNSVALIKLVVQFVNRCMVKVDDQALWDANKSIKWGQTE